MTIVLVILINGIAIVAGIVVGLVAVAVWDVIKHGIHNDR